MTFIMHCFITRCPPTSLGRGLILTPLPPERPTQGLAPKRPSVNVCGNGMGGWEEAFQRPETKSTPRWGLSIPVDPQSLAERVQPVTRLEKGWLRTGAAKGNPGSWPSWGERGGAGLPAAIPGRLGTDRGSGAGGSKQGNWRLGGEEAACWSEKNLGPNLSRVLGSSRDPLPSPRWHSLHRVLAATWNCSSFSVCSCVRSRSSGAAILQPPLRFWPVRTVTRRKWPQQQPHPVWTAAGAQLRLRVPAQPGGGNGDNFRR